MRIKKCVSLARSFARLLGRKLPFAGFFEAVYHFTREGSVIRCCLLAEKGAQIRG